MLSKRARLVIQAQANAFKAGASGKLFYRGKSVSLPIDNRICQKYPNCHNCPVALSTGMVGCLDTPFHLPDNPVAPTIEGLRRLLERMATSDQSYPTVMREYRDSCSRMCQFLYDLLDDNDED